MIWLRNSSNLHNFIKGYIRLRQNSVPFHTVMELLYNFSKEFNQQKSDSFLSNCPH